MVGSTSGSIVTQIIIGLGIYFLITYDLSAHSPTRVLVVVVDAGDAACIERIGREHVQVELLFAPHVQANNYQACAKRVSGLLNFRDVRFSQRLPE